MNLNYSFIKLFFFSLSLNLFGVWFECLCRMIEEIVKLDIDKTNQNRTKRQLTAPSCCLLRCRMKTEGNSMVT